tara:strand:- start:3101 stop:3256 length:156 start_codon:yes stop_codon:yes gene_type:complete
MGLLGQQQKDKKDMSFTKNEIDFLLRHIADCEFAGKDVLILSSIVSKLQGS